MGVHVEEGWREVGIHGEIIFREGEWGEWRCLKGGPWTVCRFKRGLGDKGVVFLRGS